MQMWSGEAAGGHSLPLPTNTTPPLPSCLPPLLPPPSPQTATSAADYREGSGGMGVVLVCLEDQCCKCLAIKPLPLHSSCAGLTI